MLGFIFLEMLCCGRIYSQAEAFLKMGYEVPIEEANGLHSIDKKKLVEEPFFVGKPGRESFINLIHHCCNPNPEERPFAAQVLKILDALNSVLSTLCLAHGTPNCNP